MPTWTILPSIETIQSISAGCIKNLGSGVVTFLGDGTFSKLYSVSDSYVMHVALPVDPYYKIASEVATLFYLSRYTTIPVPRVIAYCADANNDLGFEWILMEKMRGEPLQIYVMNDAMSTAKMEEMTKQVACWVDELRKLRFTAIGSLYFVQTLCDRGLGIKFALVENDAEFCLGPVVNTTWFAGNRNFLPSNRGPFRDETEWFQSELSLKMLATNISYPAAKEAKRLLVVYDRFLNILPSVFPREYLPSSRNNYVVHNSQMSTKNLLMDSKTFAISGWVDWGCISTVPSWATRNLPCFLKCKELDGPMAQIPEQLHESYEDDEQPIERKALHTRLHTIWMKALQIENGVDKGEAEKMGFQEALLAAETYGSEWGVRWIADREG